MQQWHELEKYPDKYRYRIPQVKLKITKLLRFQISNFRPEKMYTKTNPLSFIAITENWILKITPLTIYLAHQSDTTVTVKTSQTYNLSPQTSDEIQYLNIEVKSSRPSVEPFIIRINSENFLNLQDRLTRTINVMPDVKFHKNILERFVDVFKENMKENPRYESASQVR